MLYQRLADELVGLMEARVLRPGDRLPSVRGYSRQKRVSVATVLRTYQLLEDRGYLEVRPQSGHYVSASGGHLAPSPSVRRPSFAKEEVRVADLAWELLARVNDKGLAPFGLATAAPEHYPARRLSRILARVTREAGVAGVIYGSPVGHEALLHQVARRALGAGLTVQPDELLITNGCTEAIQLALRALMRAGEVLLVESPSYYGFLETAESLGLRVAEVPTDPETGVSLDHLDAAIRRTRPRAFLTNPTFHNPLGFLVPDDRKREQLALLARHGVAVVEDDLYGDLYFGDTRPAPLKAFDQTGDVILCSSFSKTLAPGFRVGWVAAGRHIERIRKLKLASSIHTNTLAQAGAGRVPERRRGRTPSAPDPASVSSPGGGLLARHRPTVSGGHQGFAAAGRPFALGRARLGARTRWSSRAGHWHGGWGSCPGACFPRGTPMATASG